MDGKISVGETGVVHFLGMFCEVESIIKFQLKAGVAHFLGVYGPGGGQSLIRTLRKNFSQCVQLDQSDCLLCHLTEV